MSKYSYQFKVSAVQEYLNGSHNYAVVCHKFAIASRKQLRTWVREVQAHGYESLALSRSHHRYSLDFKLQVVNYYRMHELSTDKVAVKFNLNPSQVIIRLFNLIRSFFTATFKFDYNVLN